MLKRLIGSSNIETSALALGCWRLQHLPQQQLIELIDSALNNGIHCFDHADIYGNGESEIQFGHALAAMNVQRSDLILQSKCGIRTGFYDLRKTHILESVDGILKRLQTDYLDILLLHRPDALMEAEQIAEAFNTLLVNGKVRHFGVSNFNPMQIQLLQRQLSMPIIVNQMQFGLAHTGMVDCGINANIHNDAAINRDGDVLNFCQLSNITVQAWSPLQFGMFEGNFIDHPRYPELNAALARIAEHYSVDKSVIALAWILRHPAKMQVIVGSTQVARIEQMAMATDIVLSHEQWYELYRAAGNQLP
jgi:predicted oxidoreductase